MSTSCTQPRVHSWFVIVRDEDIVRDLAIKLVHAIRQAKKEDRILKIRVQEIDEEDTYEERE